MFEALHQKITECQTKKDKLLSFVAFIEKHPVTFDKEDYDMVSGLANDAHVNEMALKADLSKRQELYEEHVLRWQQQVDTRQEKLEEFDKTCNFFSTFPEVLSVFVEKQSRLTEKLDVVKQKILQ